MPSAIPVAVGAQSAGVLETRAHRREGHGARHAYGHPRLRVRPVAECAARPPTVGAPPTGRPHVKLPAALTVTARNALIP